MAKDTYPAPIGSQPLDQNGYFVPSWSQFFQLSMVPRINASLQSVALTGDVTGSGGASFATTIAPGAVTLAKMAPLAAGSLIGNLGASPATPQAASLASVVAALPLFTATTPGIVPQSGGSASNFLRADGIWGPVTAGGGGVWGSITGTLSDQTDLNIALNGKASAAIRSTSSVTTGSIAASVTANVTIALAKTTTILQLATDYPAWVRVYATSADRTADASRVPTSYPTAGTGVCADTITTVSKLTVWQDPAAIFSNHDLPAATTAYISIKNLDTIPRSITLTVTYLPMET